MSSITECGRVPVARLQLLAEPAKLAVSVLAIGAAVALVMLLDPGQAHARLEQDGETIYFCSRGCRSGFPAGIGEQDCARGPSTSRLHAAVANPQRKGA